MLRAHFPKLTATQIKEILIKSVRPADNLKDRCTSGGIIDALQAVKLATEYKKEMRKNTVISFIGLLFCLCIQAQGTSTSVNSTVNDVDWALLLKKFSSDALEQYIKGKRPYPNWIEGSSYFYYNVKEDNGVSYYLVNAKNGKNAI